MKRIHMIWKAVEMYKKKGFYYVGEPVIRDGKRHYVFRFINGSQL